MSQKTVLKQIKNIIFEFLWKGKRDRVKRSSVINNVKIGGLNMIDVDVFVNAIKASWVPRLVKNNSKWSALFELNLQELGFPKGYIWKTSFRKIDEFPIIKKLPLFYQDVVVAFNNCKNIKPFHKLSKYEVIEQPIWGNEYFKIREMCLYSIRWLNEDVLYIKGVQGLLIYKYKYKL